MKNIALLVVALSFPAAATNGMRMPGFGAVQSSMGGVGVSASLDAATIVSNPAGLIGLDQQLELSAAYFKPTVSYNATGFVMSQGATLDSRRGASPIPTLAYVRPLGDDLAVGLGAFAVSGMGVDYAENLYGGQTYTSYMQVRIVPAVAYRVAERVTLGLGLNMMGAQLGWDAAAGAGQKPHALAMSYGVGATVGARVIATDWLSFSAAYESRSYFQDFSFDTLSDKLSFDQPMVASGGFAVTPAAGFLFAGEVQWINWSATNGTGKPIFSQNGSQAMPWDLDWKDQWVFKAGAQVEVLKGLRVRAGYDYGRMPVNATCAFENLAFPAIAEHHVTGGLGFDVGAATLNAGVTWSPKATLTGASQAQGLMSYTTEMSQVAVDAGLVWRL